MKTLADRLRAALEEAGMNQSALARAVGVSRGAVSLWLTSQTGNLAGDNLVKVAAVLRVSPVWLATGRGKMKPGTGREMSIADHPDYPVIQKVKIQILTDGEGYEVEALDEGDGPIVFARAWYARHGYKPETLVATRINGASMEPGLYDGDWVVANTEDVSPRDGEAFLVGLEGDATVKRLFRVEGQWIAASDNPDKRIHRDRPLGESSFIIGKIVHKQSERI
ncbi:XRE family transcriptional regulator [Burkholderia sp. Ax-1719]|uniref:XRE family transcriptional regulator n=1 Tax=Burkholderia sp. Ax-1719 TaxID=2608334 RepID=UPI0014216708|nr:XRE family transcriptional regulator [Burkholderia sp. Ax-1719]